MFPIPPNEHLVETKVCKHCGQSFPIMDKDLEFYEKVSPIFSGKKYQIPTPTLCPDCRQQRRLSFRNERKLYKRKCDATNKDIVSMYSPDKPFPVYDNDYWRSDKWNPMSYGKSYDFEIPFFEQFYQLVSSIPRGHVFSYINNENSTYTNHTHASKDCYLLFDAGDNDMVCYSNWVGGCKNSFDISFSLQLEDSYECLHCYESFGLSHSQNCYGCKESSYLRNCTGCSYCIGCYGLNNKQYFILNKPVTPEEFQEFKLSKMKNQDFIDAKNLLFEPESQLSSSQKEVENTHGNYIKNGKNIIYGFDVFNCQDCRYLFDAWDSSDVMDYYETWNNSSMCYEGESNGGVFHGIFTQQCRESKNILYSNFLTGCQYCFGCVALTNQSYCIFNKQYTKEEYEELVPRIIEHMMKTGEWGEFFPSSLSPFGYNETIAQEYFPLTTSSLTLLPAGEGNETFREALVPSPSPLGEGLRVRWSLYEAPFPKVEKIIPASKLPDDISKIPDDILNWAIECEVTKKPFRIIKQELEFYRKHNLPIPRRHPDQRHLDRMALRNPRKLFERLCDCPNCETNNSSKRFLQSENNKTTTSTFELNSRTGTRTKKIITTYSPDRPEKVYCEECYNREVVG